MIAPLGPDAPSGCGRVYLVGAGPGDPELITLRGWRLLHSADVVLYDALVDPRLLAGVPAERIYVGKRCGNHSVPQEQINALLAEHALTGRTVVRLKGGDPTVLGRVGEEALHLASRGVPFEIVPGISSAVSVPAYAGIPVTHRGVADSFALATAHRRRDATDFSIPDYSERTTLILLMPVTTAAVWQRQLLAQGYPDDLPVAFVSDGTRPEQRVLVTCVGEVARAVEGADLGSPTMVVVGRVVELRERLRWFADRDAARAAEDAPAAQAAPA